MRRLFMRWINAGFDLTGLESLLMEIHQDVQEGVALVGGVVDAFQTQSQAADQLRNQSHQSVAITTRQRGARAPNQVGLPPYCVRN